MDPGYTVELQVQSYLFILDHPYFVS